ncbi:hypothetical protein V7111_04960 [Neobacillus niacini]|uniref:hypothetical protein n=1 Tax=Neobacillus niacini TaxID=86668 RepID=UPI002FFE0112
MKSDPNVETATVEANIKINEQLEDGKVHAPIQANSEAERANLELQNQFSQEEQQSLRTSPANISTPQ